MARLANLSSSGAIKLGSTLADHLDQIRGKHSVFRLADGYSLDRPALPTSTGMSLATSALDN